jgi:hypothetical protein
MTILLPSIGAVVATAFGPATLTRLIQSPERTTRIWAIAGGEVGLSLPAFESLEAEAALINQLLAPTPEVPL